MRNITALGLLLLITMAVTAHAASTTAQKYNLTYDVFAGGLHAMKSDLALTYGATNYDVNLRTGTYGLLQKLADWRGTFGSDGWRSNGTTHRPRMHFSEAVWKGEVERKEFSYNRDGSFKSYKVVNEGKDETPKDLDLSLTKSTTDILSATLDVMANLNKTGSCDMTRRIFDGDRNFDMIFHHDGNENLSATKYNVYQGPSVLCTVEVKPGKGRWHQKPRGWMSIQEQGRKAGTMPTIWFAKINQDKGALYVPVKVRVKTDYGTLFMHLTSYNDGKNNLKMQVKR